MKFYKIPFDVKHEEKIFGGYLSLRQVLYLFLIILTAGIFFIKISIWIRLMMFSMLTAIFLSFAFISIKETMLDRYVINMIKFLFRKKRYQFER